MSFHSKHKTLPALEAHRIVKKLDIHYTSKHERWLDIAKIEINVMTHQGLSQRIENRDPFWQELIAWQNDRNNPIICV